MDAPTLLITCFHIVQGLVTQKKDAGTTDRAKTAQYMPKSKKEARLGRLRVPPFSGPNTCVGEISLVSLVEEGT